MSKAALVSAVKDEVQKGRIGRSQLVSTPRENLLGAIEDLLDHDSKVQRWKLQQVRLSSKPT
eukprot:304186-Amphidinium_carterae.1